MVWVVSRNFVAARHPFRKRGCRGCIEARVFTTGTISSFFATNMPNPLLYVQNSCLGWFRAISLPHVTHSENGCRGAFKARVFPPEPFLCFSQRTFPLNYFRSKTHVLGGFVQFRCRTSPIPKTCVGVHKSTSFCNLHFFVFRNEHAQSTTLGPKLIGWFRAISLQHATHSKNGCLGAFKARVFATGTISSFFATNMPNPLLWVQNSCLGVAQFRCSTPPIPKPGVWVHSKQEFLPPEPFLRFLQRTCPIHYFGSKTHVWGWFHAISLSYVTHSENGCRDAFKARVFATGTILPFFVRKHAH
jgi:hypothetical protein